MISKIKPYEGNEPYVFISYCQQDKELCDELVTALNANNIRVWFDNAVHIGDMWPDVIAEHLKGCEVCILLITNNFVGSTNCNNELTFSTTNNIPAIPLMANGTNISIGMKLMLAARKYINFDQTLPIEELLALPQLEVCRGNKTKEITLPEPPKSSEMVLVNPAQKSAYTSSGTALYLYRDSEKGLNVCGAERAEIVAKILDKNSKISLVNTSTENIYTQQNCTYPNGENALNILDGEVNDQIQIDGQVLWVATGTKAKSAENQGFVGLLSCEETGESICIIEKIILGRNYVWRSGVLNDKFISGENTLIKATNTGYVIQDVGDEGNGSVNGTWLNRSLLEAGRNYELKTGDIIQLGETVLEFSLIQIKKIQ
jgi:hypothetical protein